MDPPKKELGLSNPLDNLSKGGLLAAAVSGGGCCTASRSDTARRAAMSSVKNRHVPQRPAGAFFQQIG